MHKAILYRMIQSTGLAVFIFALSMSPSWSSASKETAYLTKKDFLKQAFNGDTPELKAVWLKGALKADISKTLGHDYPALRIRYWIKNKRFAWILDEIGKEKPITAGFVIQDNKLEMVRVLVFRESRGEEIHYPSFTRQFSGAALNEKQQMNQNIDGISGATLSVNAIRKLATVALQLSAHIQNRQRH